MKKQLKRLGFVFLLITAVIFAAFTPQQKDKNKNKDQQEGQGKKQDKSNKGGNADNAKNKGKDKDENGNKGKNDNNGNNHDWDKEYVYNWNRETFKDRQKIKNYDKVTVCHKFRSNSGPAVTLRVSPNALKAHINHGDIMGNCPPIKSHYSDIFLRRRNDYYNYLQESQEKVWYSRSILDYSRIRLADSRVQLVMLQNRRMPPADIERKRVTVTALEQNVTLLEALIGVTANILVNKLE
ncbi:MAG: hypothetical protein ABJA79_11385 [Parafilimonas sp.]